MPPAQIFLAELQLKGLRAGDSGDIGSIIILSELYFFKMQNITIADLFPHSNVPFTYGHPQLSQHRPHPQVFWPYSKLLRLVEMRALFNNEGRINFLLVVFIFRIEENQSPIDLFAKSSPNEMNKFIFYCDARMRWYLEPNHLLLFLIFKIRSQKKTFSTKRKVNTKRYPLDGGGGVWVFFSSGGLPRI